MRFLKNGLIAAPQATAAILVFSTAILSAQGGDGLESVTVNWGEEMIQGGATMIALGLLSLALVAICVERIWFLKRGRFIPTGLMKSVDEEVIRGDFESAMMKCRKSGSPLGDGLEILIKRRNADPEATFVLAGDVALRRIESEERRGVPLAVIAGLAPLLGLLGTMIGMIEAFKLVEVFGDEGGASLLAGSISKALITTAAGLVIAVPALIAFHAAKFRIGMISDDLETALEDAQSDWVLAEDGPLSRQRKA